MQPLVRLLVLWVAYLRLGSANGRISDVMDVEKEEHIRTKASSMALVRWP